MTQRWNGKERKEERDGATVREREKREYCFLLSKQVTAWAVRREAGLRETKRHLPIKRGSTEAGRGRKKPTPVLFRQKKKQTFKEAYSKKSIKGPQLSLAAWVVSHQSGILLSAVFSPNKRHTATKTYGGKLYSIYDATSSFHHSFLKEIYSESLMTSAGKRAHCDDISMIHLLRYAGLLLQW